MGNTNITTPESAPLMTAVRQLQSALQRPGWEFLPALDGYSLVSVYKGDVEHEPVVAWAFDSEGSGPYPVTLDGIDEDGRAISLPDGRVWEDGIYYPSGLGWKVMLKRRFDEAQARKAAKQ
jgi:hypothetical protein